MSKVTIHKSTHIFEYETLNGMTISLWILQLQLFELSEEELVMFFNTIFLSTLYKHNSFTNKILGFCQQEWPMSEQERLCLATHIAMQLIGLGDL